MRLQRQRESTIVDLAIDRVPALHAKRVIGNVVVDSLEEIAANSCAPCSGALSRAI